MKRKTTYILLGVSVAVIILILVVYLRDRFSVKTQPSSQVQPTPVVSEESASWEDQSGFDIQYPKSLKLDPHDEDQENYAHLELTSATYSGSLIVWTKDTEALDIDTWVKQNKIQNAIDSTLGGEKAVKVLESGASKKLVTTTIYNGYLYQIEANLADENYWNKVYNQVSSSFKFVQTETTSGNQPQGEEAQDQGDGGDIYSEGEEVIE
jgi:hypothetical protein